MKSLLVLVLAFYANAASASFLDNCQFGMEVLKTESIKTVYGDKGEIKTVLPMLGLVKTVQNLGGHTDCQHHVGTEMNIELESVSLESLVVIKKGYYVDVNYFHFNSLTPSGVVQGTTTTIVNNAQKAFNVAMQDSAVIERIEELKQTLGIADAPVILIKSSVQTLPEGFCGFVGCDSVHLLSLTYGQGFMNAPSETLVMKVYQSALGDVANVEILN